MAATVTPDGRYIIVRGRLWRTVNPNLTPDVRQDLVHRLMAARRAIGAARKRGVEVAPALRAEVDAVKHALGERGPVWWQDGAPDENRHMVHNSSYAAWYATLG